MRKLLLVSVTFLTLLAGCMGQRAAELTPTTVPTAAAAALSPAAIPATARSIASRTTDNGGAVAHRNPHHRFCRGHAGAVAACRAHSADHH